MHKKKKNLLANVTTAIPHTKTITLTQIRNTSNKLQGVVSSNIMGGRGLLTKTGIRITVFQGNGKQRY